MKGIAASSTLYGSLQTVELLSLHVRTLKKFVSPFCESFSFICSNFSCTSHLLVFVLPLTWSHCFHNNKMPSLRQILPVLAAAASVEAAMGPAFSTGPVGSGSWIRESTSTLVLPKVPSGSSGVASLWVGMGTSNGDLIQSIADNWNSVCVSYFRIP